MKQAVASATFLLWAVSASAQDQQLGARTKAMGGSYTAFEDDPVSVWLNPAGIATQADKMSISYQTYTTYDVNKKRGAGDEIDFSVDPTTSLVDPAVIPSYVGFVFQLGNQESPMAIGACVARPYHLKYALDSVSDPLQTKFVPKNNVEQGFTRFRVAFAKDFPFRKVGEAGFLTHLSVGGGADLGYESWEFSSPTGDTEDSSTSVGFGLGILLGVFDNTENFKVNLGVAYQSAIKYNFAIEPDILPAFDMPQQLNAGVTFYFLQGMPLRLTFDFQYIGWEDTAEDPLFGNHPKFEDAFNFSAGAEYRLKLSESVSLLPRAGVRYFDAPWADENDLPMVGSFKLVLDTKDEAFVLFTFGIGITWTTESQKPRSIDLAGDVGGDTFNAAIGYTHDF